MEDNQFNPFLEQENYQKHYQDNIEELRNKPELIEFDRLCFELFEINSQGKRFIELVTERYLLPALTRPGCPTFQLDVMYWEGFKEFGRFLISSVKAHKQRIQSGNNP